MAKKFVIEDKAKDRIIGRFNTKAEAKAYMENLTLPTRKCDCVIKEVKK